MISFNGTRKLENIILSYIKTSIRIKCLLLYSRDIYKQFFEILITKRQYKYKMFSLKNNTKINASKTYNLRVEDVRKNMNIQFF